MDSLQALQEFLKGNFKGSVRISEADITLFPSDTDDIKAVIHFVRVNRRALPDLFISPSQTSAANPSSRRIFFDLSRISKGQGTRIILSDGNDYEVKPLGKEEFKEKLSEESFEGEGYRTVWHFVSKNNRRQSIWDPEREVFDLSLALGSLARFGILVSLEKESESDEDLACVLKEAFDPFGVFGPL